MKKLFPYFLLTLVIGVSFSMLGCNRKPAYDDVKIEQPARGEGANAPAAEKPADPVAEVDRKAATEATQPTPQPSATPSPQPSGEAKPFVMPTFLDTQKGEIKDIPKYPKSSVTNLQYGPLGEATVVFMVLQVKDTIEKIGAFYDKELKRNGWEIVSNTRDPEFYEWNLKKGEANEGIVKVTKEGNSELMYIALTRTEKKVEPKP